jgi:hypothetical protein
MEILIDAGGGELVEAGRVETTPLALGTPRVSRHGFAA